MSGSPDFRVLFVCTGNICRSPTAERMLQPRVETLGIVVDSAGTYDLDGHPMDKSAAIALREIGIDPEGHRAKRVTERLLAQADLILTAEVSHRAKVLRQSPTALRRTFTMREFARLGAGLGQLDHAGPDGYRELADTLRDRVADVAAQRGVAQPVAAGEDDIADPIGRPLDFHQARVEQIASAVNGIIAALGVRVR